MNLDDVYWIGGAPGAGKSTIARGLAERYGLRLYATDDVMADHAGRSRDSPYLERFLAMTMDERWVERSPVEMLETFHWFRGEGFGLIVDDLRALPDGPAVVAEGFRLLPRLVRPLAAPHRALWLIPTPHFYRTALDLRGWPVAARTSDPERARRNLTARDRMFAERLAGEAGDAAVHQDGSVTLDLIAERLNLSGKAG